MKTKLGKRQSPITFFLASGSQIKIEALKSVIEEKSFDFPSVFYAVQSSESGVNEQPEGEDEILRGAINRVLSARQKDPRGEVYISMENGIEFLPSSNSWSDYAIVLAFTPSYGSIVYVKSQAVEFPTEQVQKTYAKNGSFATHTVGRTLQEDGIVRRHDDPHLDLVGVSRVEILKHALVELFQYLPQGIFLRDLH